MSKEYEQIEEVFDEREKFIEKQKDEKIYGWLCAKHLVWIGKSHSKCPLCELEAKNKVEYKPEAEEDEVIKKKREKDRERKRLAMLDPEKRKRHNEISARHYEKERIRRKEHGLI